MDRCEQAVGYHKKGFNCCQSVLAAFQDVIGSKKRSVGQAKELQKRFAERFDALRCADLLQKKFVPDDTTPAAKALGLTGHCDIMIATAVEIVEQMIAER